MEKALEDNQTLEKLELGDDMDGTLPKVFCRHILFGTRGNTSLFKVKFSFQPKSWDCPDDGRLVYVRHVVRLSWM